MVVVPPHRGQSVIGASALGDAGDWLPTDRNTLQVEGQERIFAMGDATNLPISKSGSTAHFEAPVVASRIASLIRGTAPKSNYGGRVMCFLETGNRKATVLRFDYEHPPAPPQPNLLVALGEVDVQPPVLEHGSSGTDAGAHAASDPDRQARGRMSEMSAQIVKTLDLKGLSCPLPIAKTALAVRDLQPGDLIESLATDPGSVADFAAWATSTGNEIVEQSVDDGVYRFVIRKKG